MKEKSKGRILLVDDEPDNLAVLNNCLYSNGYDVLIAQNGEAALKRINHVIPDIILMDVMMPGIDGFETCRRLKADKTAACIPILFMTVVADTEQKLQGFKAGAVDFITKPFQVEEVLARIKTHLTLRQLRIDLEEKNSALEKEMEIRRLADERLHEYSVHLEKMVENRTRELKKVQEELLIKERLALLGHFAGSISHEIRNPLAVINSSAYFLKMKLNNPDKKIRNHLDCIFRSVNKSTSIIESLLNLTRMEKPKTIKTHLPKLVRKAVLSSKIPQTIEVILNLPEKVFIEIDPEQIYMALKNIIKNAVQAMNGTGKLLITIQDIEIGDIELVIEDTGPGILPENIEKLFEPLFTTKAQGIGFGLSISKMIVENHEGRIDAESDFGAGAAFKIILPVNKKDVKKMDT